MRPQSAKAKGRRLCQEVKDLLLGYARTLQPDDIQVTSSGACGEDLKLSPAAQAVYPLMIECKCQEKINIWAAIEQARSHILRPGSVGAIPIPIVFFRKNHEETQVVLSARDFLYLTRGRAGEDL